MSNNNFFFDQNTWRELLKLGTLRKYRTDEIIFLQDQPSSGLVCLKEGKLKTCMLFPNGKEKILSILDVPYILEEMPIFDGGVYTCSAIAMAPTEIVFVSKEKTLDFLKSNPDLYRVALRVMAKKMRWMHIQANDMLFSIPERLAYLLLNYSDYGIFPNKQKDVKLIITHDELACLLGTTRPLITKYLNEFYRLELIDKGEGYIIIKDLEGLKKLGKADYIR